MTNFIIQKIYKHVLNVEFTCAIYMHVWNVQFTCVICRYVWNVKLYL